MPALAVDDVTIDYDITGSTGPLVVQLHGLTSSRAQDAQLGLDLGRALRGHRVLRYDARGHGGSTGDSDPRSYRWTRLARDLLAILDALAPGERVHAVGPSMGSGTLLHAAKRHPERFASLTLVVPPTAWATRPLQQRVYRVNAARIEREGLDAFLASAVSPVPPALADAPVTHPSVPEHLLPTVLRGAASTDFPGEKTVAKITTPTLILAWTGDPAHPITTAKRLKKLLPDSRLVVARTPYGIMAWPGLFAEHVATTGAR
ncbi:alpha/beta fold hydrolase [Microbacterium hominis]|uniref:Alpha/beta hydrolase n=1 Tax=Microbacterium hominis TaxID=162426 RepID=A0A7D4PPF9_9MICO|nr:alpha/beta hydrolase [Microbacterium hominis]QKJ20770.1 alpha/beta hydrolase [Microbacterium hominis]